MIKEKEAKIQSVRIDQKILLSCRLEKEERQSKNPSKSLSRKTLSWNRKSQTRELPSTRTQEKKPSLKRPITKHPSM